jgi:hypothetical protein
MDMAMPKIWIVTKNSRGLCRAIVETALQAGDTAVATAGAAVAASDLKWRDLSVTTN